MCALNDRGDETPEGELTDGILDQLAKFERAKTAERTRRGKLRKAREGKVVGTHAPRYGFKFNATKYAYEINEAEMEVVRRIFYMVGAEGESLRAVAKKLEGESLPTPKRGRTYAYDYYRCSNRDRHGLEACANSHKPRADKLEPEVWAFVSNLLKTPDLLRAGLEKLIEEERKATRGNPNREAEAWAKKLSEVERRRSAYQDQQAEGLITLDELRTKLAALEEARAVARRELAALKEHRERIEDLEHDADALLEHYANMVPEALDGLTPEERHRIYKMMRLSVILYADGLVEVAGAFGGLLDVKPLNSVKTESTSSSTATSRTSPRRGSGSPTT